ncbi:hypothetical protein RJG79_04530 [Mycoplasmatota bacterium WC44]
MNYSVNNNRISINKKEIEFDYFISKVICTSKILIILLDSYTEKCFDNVYAVNDKGDILWRVDSMKLYNSEKKERLSFWKIYKSLDDEIVGSCWGGFHYVIDEKSGELKNITHKYVLRFFFDWGTESCLWGANEEAKKKFGYPIELSEFNFSEKLIKEIKHLGYMWRTSVDEYYRCTWTEEESKEFNEKADNLYEKMASELGIGFYVLSEIRG